jgi:hypothetical protein
MGLERYVFSGKLMGYHNRVLDMPLKGLVKGF